MKKLVLLFVILLSVVVFNSCQKSEDFDLNAGIKPVDNPPVPLSKSTYFCWITKEDLVKAEEAGDGCDSYYDQNNQQWAYNNCGVFRTIEVKLYFGTLDNVRYISHKTITLIVDRETYYNARDLADKLGTIKGFFSSRQNPLNLNYMRLGGVDQF